VQNIMQQESLWLQLLVGQQEHGVDIKNGNQIKCWEPKEKVLGKK
jgi:hypothetical protein